MAESMLPNPGGSVPPYGYTGTTGLTPVSSLQKSNFRMPLYSPVHLQSTVKRLTSQSSKHSHDVSIQWGNWYTVRQFWLHLTLQVVPWVSKESLQEHLFTMSKDIRVWPRAFRWFTQGYIDHREVSGRARIRITIQGFTLLSPNLRTVKACPH